MYLRSGALAVALLLGGCAGGPPKAGPREPEYRRRNPSHPEATSTASDPAIPSGGEPGHVGRQLRRAGTLCGASRGTRLCPLCPAR